jgi:hypothetical protein
MSGSASAPRPDGERRTAIDAAHAALAAAEAEGRDDAGARMAFYGQVLAAELHVILEGEPEGDRLRPLLLATEAGRLVLAFDLPERIAAFLDVPRDTVALSGRSLVAMIAGQGLGIALNPDVAPSASIIGWQAVDWLAEEGPRIEAHAARVAAFRPPRDVPPALVAALESRLGAYAGRISAGWLAAAEYADGSAGLVLALDGVPAEAEPRVAAAIDEAVRFSGLEGVRLDVLFPGAAVRDRIARVGLAFRPEVVPPSDSTPPGSDPARPPRLR